MNSIFSKSISDLNLINYEKYSCETSQLLQFVNEEKVQIEQIRFSQENDGIFFQDLTFSKFSFFYPKIF
jgi:hypothetical protein